MLHKIQRIGCTGNTKVKIARRGKRFKTTLLFGFLLLLQLKTQIYRISIILTKREGIDLCVYGLEEDQRKMKDRKEERRRLFLCKKKKTEQKKKEEGEKNVNESMSNDLENGKRE
ncbi:hypothetical protein V1478_011903 [Vespula squamosa]|uniref:Uncharacterized protein n=1 Tax=Vespula squamosa TaxID=30214 RepID=A0ABD2ACE0_VESSQ